MDNLNDLNSASFSQHVSSRIKFYLKVKHMSLETMAKRIHKSKSTLSKYENGHIAVDVETLYEIAEVLDMNINQFVDYTPLHPQARASCCANPLGNQNDFYIYYYDGRTKKITKTYLLLNPNPENSEANTIPCYCYMDVPSFDKHVLCKYFYTGNMIFNDLVSYITLDNLNNSIEKIYMCFLNPFHHTLDTEGLMMGISYNPITPFTLKFVLSKTPKAESSLTKERIGLQKEELKALKTLNMILLNNMIP